MKVNPNLGDTQLIIAEGKKRGLLRNQLAYVLATALWETAHTMKPVREAFWLTEAWRKKNLRYYPWYGRGHVQITWEDNYIKAGKILGRDLTTNPDVVMQPQISVEILVIGSRDGWFRKGHTLSRYITLSKSDFFNAREIINGDKNYIKQGRKVGDTIADYAKSYDEYLKSIGYGLTGTQKPVETPKAPLPSPTPEKEENSSATLLGLLRAIFSFFRK